MGEAVQRAAADADRRGAPGCKGSPGEQAQAGVLCFLLLGLSLFFISFFAFSASAQTGGTAGSTAGPASPGSEFDAFSEFDEFGEEEAPVVYDPLIGYNRMMTRVNDRLYFWVVKPAARAYGAAVPEPARISIRRFFHNLGFPARFVNNILQLKFKGAGVELARFSINTTLGVGGLWDPAEKWLDLTPYEEDFGQTLGRYGMNGGFHLVLPLFGPSNLRDTLGRVPDMYLDPVNYVEETAVQAGAPVVSTINGASLRIGEYEALRRDAMDLYILLRSAYEQNRRKEIEE
jgi:phospholipid-binding lipoprotein MlaA